MPFPQATPEARAAFDALLPAGATVRILFGCPTAFLGDQMLMGVFGDGLFLRLPEEPRQALLELSGARLLEPIEGRTMPEYVLLPSGWCADAERVRPWLERALEYVRSLPVKEARGRGGRKKAQKKAQKKTQKK